MQVIQRFSYIFCFLRPREFRGAFRIPLTSHCGPMDKKTEILGTSE